MTPWTPGEDASIGMEIRRLVVVMSLIAAVVGVAFGFEARYNQQPEIAGLSMGQISNRCANLWMQKRIVLLEQARARDVVRMSRFEDEKGGATAERYMVNHYDHEMNDIQRTLDIYNCGIR